MLLKMFLSALKNIIKGLREKTHRTKCDEKDDSIDNLALFILLGAQELEVFESSQSVKDEMVFYFVFLWNHELLTCICVLCYFKSLTIHC